MSYEFQSMLFNTRAALCDAIAGEWISAGGMNNRDDITGALSGYTDEQLTVECTEGWGLDPEWMDDRGIDRNDIAAGFARIRSNPDAAFGLDDEE